MDRGPSTFDVRHAFNVAASYDIPTPEGRVPKAIFGGWAVDPIFRANSALPVNILTNTDPFGFGYRSVTRPDFVPGQALYLDDPSVPGGRKINRDAFVAPPSGRQGMVGRNIARGFPAWQMDLGLRRAFALTEVARLQARLEVYNIFNHANFANPSGVLSNSNFGVSTQTLNTGLGVNQLNALYQIGGPRSMQLSLKIEF
jgi:hypothetical protein